MKGRNPSYKINGNKEGNLLSSRGIMRRIVGTHAGGWTDMLRERAQLRAYLVPQLRRKWCVRTVSLSPYAQFFEQLIGCFDQSSAFSHRSQDPPCHTGKMISRSPASIQAGLPKTHCALHISDAKSLLRQRLREIYWIILRKSC